MRAILLASVVVVYTPVYCFEFVDYDDMLYLNDPHVASPFSVQNLLWALTATDAANWHPLTWLSHMVDFQLFGTWAGGPHLVNVALHALNGLLLFEVLRRATEATGPSLFAALLFAIHPLNVGSVAWVAERKNVLSTSFGLLSLAGYLRYAKQPSRGRLWGGVALPLALGLMAKPMLVTWPLLLLLLDYWPLGRIHVDEGQMQRPGIAARRIWRLAIEKWPLFALSAASSVVTLIVQQGVDAKAFEIYPLSARAANAVLSYAKYLGAALWPANLAVLYPYPAAFPAWQVAGAALVLIAATAGAIGAARRFPYVAVGWFWYLVSLLPVIGIVQVGEQAMADRYTYVPLIGIFVLIAWSIAEAASRSRIRPRMLWGIAGAAALPLVVVSAIQVMFWRDSESLFARALAVTRENATAQYNMGLVRLGQGNRTAAVQHFTEAVRIDPDKGDAQNNLAILLAEMGRADEALAHYIEAARSAPDNESILLNVANALLLAKRPDEARTYFERVIELDPGNAVASTALTRIRSAGSAVEPDQSIPDRR